MVKRDPISIKEGQHLMSEISKANQILTSINFLAYEGIQGPSKRCIKLHRVPPKGTVLTGGVINCAWGLPIHMHASKGTI